MGTVRSIRIANRTGFCYGVREAIDKAKESSAAGKQTTTLGQVVHNEGVIADLERLGIETVDTLDDVDHGAAVVIRAHGVRPEVMERASERGLEVIVVVGGRSSANTKGLTRLCGIVGTPAVQIEGVRDLASADAFDGVKVVGVTGGTSTPIEDLRDVARRVLEIAGTPDAHDHAAELALAA